MAGFISAADEMDYQSNMALLHDTYAKPVAIFQTAQKTVVNTNPNHNFLYSSGPNQTSVANILNSGTYNLRIHYPHDNKWDVFAGGGNSPSQINMNKKDYVVKIICSGDVAPILQNCSKIEFNNVFYQIESDSHPHGIVAYQFYDFYLKAIN